MLLLELPYLWLSVPGAGGEGGGGHDIWGLSETGQAGKAREGRAPGVNLVPGTHLRARPVFFEVVLHSHLLASFCDI